MQQTKFYKIHKDWRNSSP